LKLGARRRRAVPDARLARRAVVPVPCSSVGRTDSVITAALMLMLAFAAATGPAGAAGMSRDGW
jgi:hypothetical protein